MTKKVKGATHFLVTDFGALNITPEVAEILAPKDKRTKKAKRAMKYMEAISRVHMLAYEAGLDHPSDIFVKANP